MTRGEREGWRLGPRQQRTTRRRGGRRASALCSGTRGDGRLCDALIILKQSLAGRPCIVQKSRGNSEKEEGGGWVVRLSAGKRHAAGESTLVDAFISRLRNPRSSDSPSTNRPCPRHRGRDSPWKPQKNACRYAYLSDDTPLLPQDTTTFSQTTSSTNQPLFRQLKHRSTDIRSRFLVVVVRGIADIGPKMCPMFIGTYVYTNFLYIYTGVE